MTGTAGILLSVCNMRSYTELEFENKLQTQFWN